jgi:hypothetical protein
MKNREELVSTWGASGYHSGSNSIILYLNKNDRVYVNVQEGTIHETDATFYRGYTSFSGYRIN